MDKEKLTKEELTDWLWMVAGCLGILVLWYIGWEVTKHIIGD